MRILNFQCCQALKLLKSRRAITISEKVWLRTLTALAAQIATESAAENWGGQRQADLPEGLANDVDSILSKASTKMLVTNFDAVAQKLFERTEAFKPVLKKD